MNGNDVGYFTNLSKLFLTVVYATGRTKQYAFKSTLKRNIRLLPVTNK